MLNFKRQVALNVALGIRIFFIILEKVYTFKSLKFFGIDFQRSIALNEIICLPVFVLTCGLYNFFWDAYLVL